MQQAALVRELRWSWGRDQRGKDGLSVWDKVQNHNANNSCHSQSTTDWLHKRQGSYFMFLLQEFNYHEIYWGFSSPADAKQIYGGSNGCIMNYNVQHIYKLILIQGELKADANLTWYISFKKKKWWRHAQLFEAGTLLSQNRHQVLH